MLLKLLNYFPRITDMNSVYVFTCYMINKMENNPQKAVSTYWHVKQNTDKNSTCYKHHLTFC